MGIRKRLDNVDKEIIKRGKLPAYVVSDREFRNSEFYQAHREIYEGL